MVCRTEAPALFPESGVDEKSVWDLDQSHQDLWGALSTFRYHSPCDAAYEDVVGDTDSDSEPTWWERLVEKLEIAAGVGTIRGSKGVPTNIIKGVVKSRRRDPRIPMIERLTQHQKDALLASNDRAVNVADVAKRFGMKPKELKNLRLLIRDQQAKRVGGEQIVVDKNGGPKRTDSTRPSGPPKPLGSNGWEALEKAIKERRARGPDTE